MMQATQSVRTYRMTVATTWYDEETGQLLEYESHYKVASKGEIQDVRKQLTETGLDDFRRFVRNQTGHLPALHRVRVSFEREEPALAEDDGITIESRTMRRVGSGDDRHWSARKLPTRRLRWRRRGY